MTKLEQITNRKLWLAPLAGYTDISFRTICKECGADVVVSEMVSADGLTRIKDKSMTYTRFTESQRPFGIQLFGSDPLTMAKAIDVVLPVKPDFIDINMGCPVKKVVKRGAGSALLKSPKIAFAIVREMKKALAGTDIPLTVKIRSGWDSNNINYLDIGKRLEQSGADIIILHARTRTQMYSGHSNWQHIKELVKVVSIPIVGNGDVTSVEDSQTLYRETSCDSIMIGRGALGNPWLFNEIKLKTTDESVSKIRLKEKFDTIEKHCRLVVQDKGKDVATQEMKPHFSFYTKGFKGGAKIRGFINRNNDIEESLEKVRELYYGCS